MFPLHKRFSIKDAFIHTPIVILGGVMHVVDFLFSVLLTCRYYFDRLMVKVSIWFLPECCRKIYDETLADIERQLQTTVNDSETL